MIGQTGSESKYWERGSAPGGNRFPETAVLEKVAYFEAVGGETSIDAGGLSGDKITWNAGSFAKLQIQRSTLGLLIPFFPGMTTSNWTVKSINPPTIEFSTALAAGEVVVVRAPNSFQTVSRPEELNFSTDRFVIPAAGTQTTFQLSRPIKLTWHNGKYRGMHYSVSFDRDEYLPNTPVGSDFDFTEDVIAGTDTFGSITFNSAIGGPAETHVKVQSLGFYDADNISLQQLVSNSSRISTIERAVIQKDTTILTGGISLGTTIIPMDGTIPQISEGDNVVGLATTFTPKSTSSKIRVRVVTQLSASAASTTTVALFKDSAVAAVAAGVNEILANEHGSGIGLIYEYTNSALTPILFNVRIGGHSGATTQLNQDNSGGNLGGIISSWIEVEEHVV